MASGTLTEQRISECLHILNDRQVNALTRLYHMKHILDSREHRPPVMPGGDKTYDSAWKVLLKKFPSADFKSNVSAMHPFMINQKEILFMLSPYYYNLVEALYIKDHFCDLLGRIGLCYIQFDININPDLTRLYLELISNHFALMLLISRITDTKAILALFNFFFDQINGKSEADYPRMAEFFTDSPELMLKSLHLTVNPYSRAIAKALFSVNDHFVRRTVRSQNWNDSKFLDILTEPGKLTHTVLGDKLICELISYETLERWIVFGYMLIYPELKEDDAFSRLKVALRNSFVVVLFRDEVINVHSLLQSYLEAPWCQKIGAKRISEIKETFSIACTQAPEVHSDRRAYLRYALKQLNLVLSDEPGLIGPKAFIVLWALSYAVDEVRWLLRHCSHPAPSSSGKKASASQLRPQSAAAIPNELKDPFLPELLFLIDELRTLVQRYAFVIQRFYLQFLTQADCSRLSEQLKLIHGHMSDEHFAILESMCKELADIANNKALFDTTTQTSFGKMRVPNFESLRLDWLRLQVLFTSKTANFNLTSYPEFAEQMHSIVFHSRLVDFIDELLRMSSDLSTFIFYSDIQTILFDEALNTPTQLRFAIVFPSLCGQAVNACHSSCPEEKTFLAHKSYRLARHYCQSIAVRICQAILVRVDEFGELADQLDPPAAVRWLVDDKLKKRKNRNRLSKGGNSGAQKIGTAHSKPDYTGFRLGEPDADGAVALPGFESYRRDRADQTAYDKSLFTLTQLCQTVNHHTELVVADELLQPREILHLELQSRLIVLLSSYPLPQSGQEQHSASGEALVTKPSELLRRVRALMNVLLDLENHVAIDVIGVFSMVFAHQSQLLDGFNGQPTMTSHYCTWYRENLIKHAYNDHFVYSPLLKSFVTMVPPDRVRFRAEEYADLNELKALAQLIGPLGIRELCDQLMQDVGERVDKLHALVLQNRATLEDLRGCFDDPGKTRQFTTCLQSSDQFLRLLIEIGIVLAFKKLCHEALNDNLQLHIPFLLDTIKHLQSYVSSSGHGDHTLAGVDQDAESYSALSRQLAVSNLGSNMGLPTDLDYGLCVLLNARQQSARQAALQAGLSGPDDYEIACLLVVFAATALPSLARQPRSIYHVGLEANENNSHCLVYSINTLMVSTFSLLRPGDLEARSQEFLALASSNLLRLGLESTSSVISSDVCSSSSGATSASAPSSLHNFPTTACLRDSVYILFDGLVRHSPCLSHTLQEACFPYSLIRTAYHNVAEQSRFTGSSSASVNRQPSMTASQIEAK